VPSHLVTNVGWYSNTNVYIPKISGSHNQQVPTILKGLFIVFLIISRQMSGQYIQLGHCFYVLT